MFLIHSFASLFFRLSNRCKLPFLPRNIRWLQPSRDLHMCSLLPWSESAQPGQRPTTENSFLLLPTGRPPQSPRPKGRSRLDRGEPGLSSDRGPGGRSTGMKPTVIWTLKETYQNIYTWNIKGCQFTKIYLSLISLIFRSLYKAVSKNLWSYYFCRCFKGLFLWGKEQFAEWWWTLLYRRPNQDI